MLEDRLQTRVEGSLGDALAASRNDDVKALSSILLAVDRCAGGWARPPACLLRLLCAGACHLLLLSECGNMPPAAPPWHTIVHQ